MPQIIHMPATCKMEDFAMSLSKYLLSFFLCGTFFILLFAEEKTDAAMRQSVSQNGKSTLAKHEKNPLKNKKDQRFLVCELFNHIIEDIPFDSSWNIHWSEQTNDFFSNIIPDEVKKYQARISFAGEFLRFLRPRIIGTKYNFFSLCIYSLSSDVVMCRYTQNLKVKNIQYLKESGLPVCEFLVRLNSYVKKALNGQSVTYARQQYFYIGGTVLSNGNMRMEYGEILANEGFPLKNKVPALNNIPDKILNEFQEWLKTQQEKYKKCGNAICSTAHSTL